MGFSIGRLEEILDLSIGVFCISNKQDLQDHVFLVLSWSCKQELQGFILVKAPLDEVIALRPAVCY
jgi:hypothetical protein